MKKSAKYCVECQESYADRFGFCPVCGAPLKAAETETIAEKSGVKEDNLLDLGAFFDVSAPATIKETGATFQAEERISESKPIEMHVPETQAFETTISTNGQTFSKSGETTDFSEKPIAHNGAKETAKPLETPKTFAKATGSGSIVSVQKPVSADGANGFTSSRSNDDEYYSENDARYFRKPDDLYHLTIIEKPKIVQRLLTLGALLGLFILINAFIGIRITEILSANPMIEDPEGGLGLISYVAADPYQVDPETPKKNTDEGGGGGGGGKEAATPASFGREAIQLRTPPVVPPSVDMVRKKDPALPQTATTEGPERPYKENLNSPYGVKNGVKDGTLSDGTGRGGGQGDGEGRGQGGGRGGGAGDGEGTGKGSGKGNTIGNGNGDGDNAPPPPTPRPKPTQPPPTPAPVGPTVGLNVTSKPRPGYTEEARKNQIQGTVRLRVTFNANGTIGSISPISGLGYGLTEKAIEAARQMRFEPAKKGGVPYTVTKEVVYTFNLL